MKSNEVEEQAGIACVEVLVAKRSIDSGLRWTLSVYSLENRPVRKNLDIHHSEIFHFMLYDWDRSIRALLESHNVAFTVVQEFFVADISQPEDTSADPEVWLRAAEDLAQGSLSQAAESSMIS